MPTKRSQAETPRSPSGAPVRPATLQAVADLAGVSLATASRALNNGTDRTVGESLRARVLRAAEQLQYAPNAHARALAGATSSTVGFITNDVADPYFSTIARGLMRVADRAGKLVLTVPAYGEPERTLACFAALRDQRAHAIVLAGSGFDEPEYLRRMANQVALFQSSGGRVTTISEHLLGCDSVLPANADGAEALGRAMVKLGHRRFAILSGPPHLLTVQDRKRGFLKGVAAATPAREVTVVEDMFTDVGGFQAMQRLLDAGVRRGRRRLPDATCVLAMTDAMAMGALRACREVGLRVPKDVSVSGFADVPVTADLNPPLTSVHLDLERMGELAMDIALHGDPTKRQVHRLPAQVIERASTGAPRP